ncbi:uncharacterized protein [Antennarius striatus]|uniref:uncharacterized protein isoform X1 n=1 Tax=Antennarius striatus TaxID=241820 RepID=UPI0035B3761E
MFLQALKKRSEGFEWRSTEGRNAGLRLPGPLMGGREALWLPAPRRDETMPLIWTPPLQSDALKTFICWDQGPAPWTKDQGPAPWTKDLHPGPRTKDLHPGPRTCTLDQGPAPWTKDQGPAPWTKDQGPAPWTKDQGPAPWTKDQGPAPWTKDQGPVPWTKDQGPAPWTKDQGPVPWTKDQVPVPWLSPQLEGTWGAKLTQWTPILLVHSCPAGLFIPTIEVKIHFPKAFEGTMQSQTSPDRDNILLVL